MYNALQHMLSKKTDYILSCNTPTKNCIFTSIHKLYENNCIAAAGDQNIGQFFLDHECRKNVTLQKLNTEAWVTLQEHMKQENMRMLCRLI